MGMQTDHRRAPADPAAAQARLQAAHETLTALVEGLQSGEDWRNARRPTGYRAPLMSSVVHGGLRLPVRLPRR